MKNEPNTVPRTMKFRKLWKNYEDMLILIPTVTIGLARCEDERCETVHGFSLCIGWLFWQAGVGVAFVEGNDAKEDEGRGEE